MLILHANQTHANVRLRESSGVHFLNPLIDLTWGLCRPDVTSPTATVASDKLIFVFLWYLTSTKQRAAALSSQMRHKHLYKCPTGVQKHREMIVLLGSVRSIFLWSGNWKPCLFSELLKGLKNNVLNKAGLVIKAKQSHQNSEPVACSMNATCQQSCMVLIVYQTKLKDSHHARRLALCTHAVNYWPGLTCTCLTCLFAGLWLLRHHPRRRFSLPVLTRSHAEDSLTSLQEASPESQSDQSSLISAEQLWLCSDFERVKTVLNNRTSPMQLNSLYR